MTKFSRTFFKKTSEGIRVKHCGTHNFETGTRICGRCYKKIRSYDVETMSPVAVLRNTKEKDIIKYKYFSALETSNEKKISRIVEITMLRSKISLSSDWTSFLFDTTNYNCIHNFLDSNNENLFVELTCQI